MANNAQAVTEIVLRNALMNARKNEGDFVKDGILYCGKCGGPKQAYIDWLPDENGVAKKRLVPVICQCDKDEDKQNAEKAEQERFNVSLRRLRSTVDAAQAKWTFDDDDAADSSVSKALRKYAARWEDMKRHNEGILLYGSKGTGKSFYASCLVNELVQKRQTAAFVPVAGLMSTLQGSWSRTEIIEALCRFQLLALDDLGAERETSFSAELLYTVIDARYRTQKPTIITTNLDLADMRSETDLLRSRIYDRVIEMCPITIDMVGASRRAKLAEDRKQIARDLLR